MARRCPTTCLPFDRARHAEVVADPSASRPAPELFPGGPADGYRLRGRRPSRKLALPLRRTRPKATGDSFTVRPSFALPHMAGRAGDASGPPSPRAPGVPFRAPARVLGRDHANRYRVEVGLLRHYHRHAA